MEQKKKSMFVTVFLSTIVPGTGHIYLGDVKKGIEILLLFVAANTLFYLEAGYLNQKGLLDASIIDKIESINLNVLWTHIFFLIVGLLCAFVILIWALFSSVKICSKANEGGL